MRTELAQKVELRVAKTGPLRFLSHHDMLRLLERSFRRAALPLRLTSGFNPRPRIVLPLPLEVGTESVDEPVELELSSWMPVAEIRSRVASALHRRSPLRSVKLLPPRRGSQTPVEALYECRLSDAGVELAPSRIDAFLSQAEIPWIRRRPREDKHLDLRSAVLSMELSDGILRLLLKAGPGSARPAEILAWLTDDPHLSLLVPVKRLRTVLSPVELGGRPVPRRRQKR
ncbi:MAG: DUF2344 domain-containing protein [Planctomycetes bacterium]|nr:DUF2344 domain-containing protein [Planctomycetota bacterium]